VTHEQLISALADDQEISRTKAEDILQAIADLCAETLSKGEPFAVGNTGRLMINPRLMRKENGVCATLIFDTTKRSRPA